MLIDSLHRRWSGVVIAATIAAACSSSAADQLAYAVDFNNSLFMVNYTDNSVQYLLNFDDLIVGPASSLASSPTGELYVGTLLGDIYQIDPDSGSAVQVADTGVGNITGLDFMGDTLVMFNSASRPLAFEVDLTDGSYLQLAWSDTMLTSTGSASFEDENTLLFTGNSETAVSTLYAMDINTGETTVRGELGAQISAMDFIDGDLFGGGGFNSEYSIDPNTGQATMLPQTTPDGVFLYRGLTVVPTPSSLSILTLTLIGSMRRKRI